LKFTKKPVTVDAMQFTGSNQSMLMRWAEELGIECRWEFREGALFITTLEGVMRADPMDWVIVGVNREQYPCKPDVFEKTYDFLEPEFEFYDPYFTPGEFEPWNGDYVKCTYLAKIGEEIVACWPNAGEMVSCDGSGRVWGPGDKILVRKCTQEEHMAACGEKR
jgi:hypothetical protein